MSRTDMIHVREASLDDLEDIALAAAPRAPSAAESTIVWPRASFRWDLPITRKTAIEG